jgi:uncharacterized protein (DUF885 family)
MSEVVDLADQFWAYHRATAQLWNVDRGDVEQIREWEDLSPAGVAERVRQLRGFAERAEALRTQPLAGRERAMVSAVVFSAASTASTLAYVRDLALVAGPFNFSVYVSLLLPGYALATAEHGAGYVHKLRSMPTFVDGLVQGFREGAAMGRVATARGVNDAIAALETMMSTDPSDDPLLSQEPPAQLSAAEAGQWRDDVINAIRNGARPALDRLRTALRDDLAPVARSDEHAGMCHLPDGESGYAAMLRAATSTDLEADAIHALGLAQLELLDEEYRQLGRATLGLSDAVEVRRRMRDDPALRYTSAEAIVADAMAALARAEAAADQWFNVLPRARCNAVAVDNGPMAFYTAPSPDGARGGTFFFRTGDPSSWAHYELEVTTFHESIPGHHLQLALAQEMDLHPVLGQLEVTSYAEGWGLYTERLADEMGLYSTPLQRLGMLSLDSLRAARLVVDTGLHALGWSREQAVTFMTDTTTQDRANAESEVDRYIGDPGQATAYMVGRVELNRLRALAQTSLGEKFSIRRFHDIVLANGMVPLDELARSVEDWIAAPA